MKTIGSNMTLGLMAFYLATASPPAAVAAETVPPGASYAWTSGVKALVQDEGTFSRTVEVGPEASLALSNPSGDIVIRGGEGDAIHIEADKGRGGDPSRARIEVMQTGDRVRVETQYAGGGHERISVDFEITVPVHTAVSVESVSGSILVANVNGELRAESVSGDVTVHRAKNLLLAKTVSGEMEVADVSALEDVEIGSVSGDVVVDGLRAPGVHISSVSGDVTVDDAACDRASLSSVSGELHFRGRLSRSGRYDFESHSGDVVIGIANEIGFEIQAESFSGDLESDLELTPKGGRQRRGALHGVYGDGTAMIEASTFSGDVRVTRP